MLQYTNLTELNADLLNTLIERIEIHNAVMGDDRVKRQKIDIFYRFVGKIS